MNFPFIIVVSVLISNNVSFDLCMCVVRTPITIDTPHDQSLNKRADFSTKIKSEANEMEKWHIVSLWPQQLVVINFRENSIVSDN